MELTLTTRWVEYKSSVQTKEIAEGTPIEYYGNGMLSRPSCGQVVFKFGEPFIEWEDTPHDTPLDGSEQSNKILSDCGFSF